MSETKINSSSRENPRHPEIQFYHTLSYSGFKSQVENIDQLERLPVAVDDIKENRVGLVSAKPVKDFALTQADRAVQPEGSTTPLSSAIQVATDTRMDQNNLAQSYSIANKSVHRDSFSLGKDEFQKDK